MNQDASPRSVETLYAGRFVRLQKVGRWEFVERTKAAGIVAISAVTENQEIVLIEQFSPPLNLPFIELPAGLAGDTDGAEDEAFAVAAKRELLEETGYEAEKMEFFTAGPSSAGLSTEIISFYGAFNVKKVAAGGGFESEKIKVHAVPLATLDEWLETKRKAGYLIGYKVFVALAFIAKRQK